ncbi:MAG: AAA family ATPase [Sulfuricella sp.]|nr:AAA family ATPase [Sulfuricella sp.]
MYLDHFGLSQAPFKITPNTGFFYTGGNRGAILDALLYAIIHGEGIVKVTGEIGSGKTMLCRMLESMLPDNIEAIYLANPSLNRDDVFHVIASELSLATQGKRASETLHLIQDYLIEKHSAGKQVVLLVEEAQAMPLDTLEEIRLLSNLETAHHKLLQIVLFGQPELDENLGLPRMRQLKERITHSFTVPPLAGKEIPEYLMFRMHAAGYRGPDIFGAGAVKLIANASQGITRRINVLADKALLAAFSLNTHNIRPKHVKAAIKDAEFSGAASASPSLKRIGFSVMLLGLGMAIGVGWQDISNLSSFITATAPVPAPVAKPVPQPPVATPALPAAQPVIQEEPAPASSAQAADEAPPPSAQEKPAQAPTAPQTTPQGTPSPIASTPLPNLLQQRLDATRAWLDKADDAHFSIQLMIADSDAEAISRLERFFQRNALELQQLYVYPSSLTGKSGFGVLFGNFATRDQALASLASLPREMKISRPIIRTVRGVKAEITGQRHDN